MMRAMVRMVLMSASNGNSPACGTPIFSMASAPITFCSVRQATITTIPLLRAWAMTGSHRLLLHTNRQPSQMPKKQRGKNPKNWKWKALNSMPTNQTDKWMLSPFFCSKAPRMAPLKNISSPKPVSKPTSSTISIVVSRSLPCRRKLVSFIAKSSKFFNVWQSC